MSFDSGYDTKIISIPHDMVGVIIGTKGSTIKKLEEQSNAKIKVSDDLSSERRSVFLKGTAKEICEAEVLVNEILHKGRIGYIQAKKMLVAVAVFVLNGTSVLLGRRLTKIGFGTFALPGGVMEFGEDFHMCAIREVKEETGLDIEHISVLDAQNFVHEGISNPPHVVTIVVKAFLSDAKQKPINLEPSKHESWDWFHWGFFPEPLFKPLKNLIDTGFNPFIGRQFGFAHCFKAHLEEAEGSAERFFDLLQRSGHSLLRDERDAHVIRGFFAQVVTSQKHQVMWLMHTLRQYEDPLQRYLALTTLQVMNEGFFYRSLIDNVEELLPVIYTPTVGKACQKYGNNFCHSHGICISLKEKGKILEVLKHWPERNIHVIVVTDGECISGHGDLGCQGIGVPARKLSLYTAFGGIYPSTCLPITIDVGTNNKKLLDDALYIGLKQSRVTGHEYTDLLGDFMSAVKENYGENVLIQFEGFAIPNAFELLKKYSKTHLVFNDDFQGTASVVLAGLFASLKLVGGTLGDHRFLFLGAAEVGSGIAELIALEMSKQTKAPMDECRVKIWLVDSKGLIVKSRLESLEHCKIPWAHEHEPVRELIDVVNAIKPTVLIGSSGAGQTFTQEVVEAMASFNEKPIIFALSNPTMQSECTAEEAFTWSEGRAIFASGSPFAPVQYNGKTYTSSQASNAYIFPGFGLGLVMSGAIHVHDDMLLLAAGKVDSGSVLINFN